MSMSDKEGYIWSNGEVIAWKDAKIHVLTHSLHYGLAIFEGVRAYETSEGAAIFRLQDHTRRLFDSAKITGMNIPFTEQEINQAHIEVVRQNKHNSCYFRPMAYYGSQKLGVAPDAKDVQVFVSSWEWGAYLGEEALSKGIRVKVSSFSRSYVNSILCKAKVSGNYLNSIYAVTESLRDGYDESILLDKDGYVAEGSGENIFMVRHGKVYTPTLTYALEGITRDTVIHLLQDFGYELIEKNITRDELYIADEVFFTGTAAEVTPISEIDGRQIGSGSIGKVTKQIQSAYFDLVQGKNAKYKNWLTFVK